MRSTGRCQCHDLSKVAIVIVVVVGSSGGGAVVVDVVVDVALCDIIVVDAITTVLQIVGGVVGDVGDVGVGGGSVIGVGRREKRYNRITVV